MPLSELCASWGEQFEQLGLRNTGLDEGVVTVGISSSGYYRWLSAHLISDFCKSYPNIEVRVLDGLSSELAVALERAHGGSVPHQPPRGRFPLATERMPGSWPPGTPGGALSVA
jgi:DNA-binding transcriptional LysR family regulator